MSQENNELPLVRLVANLERYMLAQGNADIYYNVVIGTRLQLQSNLRWPQDKG
ncbi:hypothetical protein BGZ59_000493, partial [Podila verticillata]